MSDVVSSRTLTVGNGPTPLLDPGVHVSLDLGPNLEGVRRVVRAPPTPHETILGE